MGNCKKEAGAEKMNEGINKKKDATDAVLLCNRVKCLASVSDLQIRAAQFRQQNMAVSTHLNHHSGATLHSEK